MRNSHVKWQAVEGGQWILWHDDEPVALIQKLASHSFECTVGESSIRVTNLLEAKAAAMAEAIAWIAAEARVHTHC